MKIPFFYSLFVFSFLVVQICYDTRLCGIYPFLYTTATIYSHTDSLELSSYLFILYRGSFLTIHFLSLASSPMFCPLCRSLPATSSDSSSFAITVASRVTFIPSLHLSKFRFVCLFVFVHLSHWSQRCIFVLHPLLSIFFLSSRLV